MGIIRLNAIKHYTGTQAELPATLPYGDTYLTTDTNKLFKYNQDGLPKDVSKSQLSASGYSRSTAFVGDNVYSDSAGTTGLARNHYRLNALGSYHIQTGGSTVDSVAPC
jgi:hypothetical protein